MKIAHIGPVYPPYFGGMGTVAQEYVEDLRADGIDAHVFVPDYGNQDSSEYIHRLKPILKFGNAAIIPSLFKQLKDFDVIHIHYPFYGSALIATLAGIFWGIPMVLTYHMKTKARGFKGWFFKLQRFFIEPFILRVAKEVLVSSIDYAKSIGLKERYLTDMPFSVDEKRFTPDLDKIEDLKNKKTIFLFVGGLDDAHYFKGVDVLLESVSRIDGDWALWIVGSGNLKSHYEKLVEELNIQNQVKFWGRVKDEDLPKLYRKASVHILPSIDRSEAFGLVTLEAASSGIPSIVSDLPGVRTLVESEVSGFIVGVKKQEEIRSAMKKMMNDPDLCRNMGLQARSRVQKNYTKFHCLNRLKDVYNRVIVKKL